MDDTLRTLERAAALAGGEREVSLRLAAAQVRTGELVALTEVLAAPPRRHARERCTRQRSLPRLYILREPDSGDLTPRARQAVLRKVVERLGWFAVRANWTRFAGCTCGCSPAFVLRGKGTESLGDTYVRVLVAESERAMPRSGAPSAPWQPRPLPSATTSPSAASVTMRSALPAPAQSAASARRLPPVGTRLQKLDRRGVVRCEATVLDAGVLFQGTVHPSLSAAALAAARTLGLAAKSLNGWAWWGIENPRRTVRRTRPAPKTTAPHDPACLCCGGRHGLLGCPDMGR